MKKTLLLICFVISTVGWGQTAVQSVNSGSLITSASSVSIGEIIVIPDDDQPQSGLIGILAQINNLQLEVPEMELATGISVYPNPTASEINFASDLAISGEKISVYNSSGQLIAQKQISSANAVDLGDLAAGIYILQFENKQINTFKIVKH